MLQMQLRIAGQDPVVAPRPVQAPGGQPGWPTAFGVFF